LADFEGLEFCRFYRCYANECDEFIVIEVALCHSGAITFDEEGLFGFSSHESAVLPGLSKKICYASIYFCPCCLVVGFESYPLCTFLNRLLQVNEQSADIDVFPFGIAT